MKPAFLPLLACPVCHAKLDLRNEGYACPQTTCSAVFPIIQGLPILVSEALSSYNIASYAEVGKQTRRLRKRLRNLIPRISRNSVAATNFREFRERLLAQSENPLVVILGGAEVGAGVEKLLDDPRIQCMESDIVMGHRNEVVFDASYIPLASKSVDGVVIQAVLEYLPDPAQAVSEIYRVLRDRGLVYSEMPFLQDVHGGRYDFTRLTHLGHLRLYRQFEELKSGACGGPASAFAWTAQHLMLCFARTPKQRDVAKMISGLLFFWLKYLDHFLLDTPCGLDGATGTFVLGRKSAKQLSDRELVARYRGAVPATGII